MPASNPNRRYRRVGLPQGPWIAWKGSGDRIVSRVRTLGLGGLFILTAEPLRVGEFLQLFFEISGREIRAQAVVRSSTQGDGMGVEFIAMNPDSRARLQSLISQLAGNAYVENGPTGAAN